MYLRFVTGIVDPGSGLEQGIITVADEIWYEKRGVDWLLRAIRAELDWFNERLACPGLLWSQRRKWNGRYGVCWFRDSAVECIAHARHLAWIVDEAGIPTRAIRTLRPGEIIWRDAHQIVAVANRSGPVIVE